MFYAGYYLGFFCLGESILKKFLKREKYFVRPSRGVWKAFKNSVQDWLKSHFWTLVTLIDFLIIRSVFKIAFNFFSGKLLLFFGGGGS